MPRMTQQEVDAYNLRQVSKAVPVDFGDACEVESKLHQDIREECGRRGWIVLTGSMAHRAMRTPGEFDFTILADAGRVFFVEAKTRTGKLTVEQAALKHWAENLGHTPAVVRSLAEFLEVIKEQL
jgi:hypothetical protein